MRFTRSPLFAAFLIAMFGCKTPGAQTSDVKAIGDVEITKATATDLKQDADQTKQDLKVFRQQTIQMTNIFANNTLSKKDRRSQIVSISANTYSNVEETISRLSESLRRMLKKIKENPQAGLGERFEIVTRDELERLIANIDKLVSTGDGSDGVPKNAADQITPPGMLTELQDALVDLQKSLVEGLRENGDDVDVHGTFNRVGKLTLIADQAISDVIGQIATWEFRNVKTLPQEMHFTLSCHGRVSTQPIAIADGDMRCSMIQDQKAAQYLNTPGLKTNDPTYQFYDYDRAPLAWQPGDPLPNFPEGALSLPGAIRKFEKASGAYTFKSKNHKVAAFNPQPFGGGLQRFSYTIDLLATLENGFWAGEQDGPELSITVPMVGSQGLAAVGNQWVKACLSKMDEIAKGPRAKGKFHLVFAYCPAPGVSQGGGQTVATSKMRLVWGSQEQGADINLGGFGPGNGGGFGGGNGPGNGGGFGGGNGPGNGGGFGGGNGPGNGFGGGNGPGNGGGFGGGGFGGGGFGGGGFGQNQ